MTDLHRLRDIARRLTLDRGADENSPQQLAWSLIRMHYRAQRKIPYGLGRGYPVTSSLPDPHHTAQEIFVTERDRLIDRVNVDTDERTPLTTIETTVHDFLNPILTPRNLPARDPRTALRALEVYAIGGTPALVRTITGVKDSALRTYKRRACELVTKALHEGDIAA